MDAARQQIAQLQANADADADRQQIAHLQANADVAHQDNAQLQADADAASQQIAQLQDDADAAHQQHEVAVAQLHQTHVAEVTDLEERVCVFLFLIVGLLSSWVVVGVVIFALQTNIFHRQSID
jgi:predicted  nucleic acid-binding Zn-ribbon protein